MITKTLAILRRPTYLFSFLGIWFLVFTLFLWVPQINLLAYILTQAPLDGVGKVNFILEYYWRVLAVFGNPIVLTLVIFSALTAVSIVLLVYMLVNRRATNTGHNLHGKAYSGVAISAFGSHFLSCGGTLLIATLFPTFSGSSAVIGGSGANINLWLSTTANLIGIAIVIYTIRKLAKGIRVS